MTRLTDVATKHDIPDEHLAVALDTVLTARTNAYPPHTDTPRSGGEQALDLAVLLADSFGVDEVADRLGIPAFAVTRYAHDGDLLAVALTGEDGTPRFPIWQFTDTTDDGVLPYLGAVLRRIPGDVSPLAVTRWMTTPHPGLTVEDGVMMSPRVWLLYVGEPGPVLDVAPGLGTPTK